MQLRLSKYINSVRQYASFLFFLTLAILILLSSSLLLSLNILDIHKHSQQLVISDPGSEHSSINKELLTGGDRPVAALQHAVSSWKSHDGQPAPDVLKKEHKLVKEEIDDKRSTAASILKETKSQFRRNCDGRRIYMYNLPAEFNALILRQCNNTIADWLNFCPHFVNHGFGKAVSSANWVDWYETDFYMLEVIFHSRMAVYPCLTHAAHEADAFFIPYYSGLDALHYLYGEKRRQWREQGVNLVRWLNMETQLGGKYWRRRGGRDHFIVMGRTAWDLTRALSIDNYTTSVHQEDGSELRKAAEADQDLAGWGTSFANLPEMENVTAFFIERRPWRWLEQAIPYPTGFHPSSLQTLRAWQDKVRAAKRAFLLAFVGGPRPHESSSSELRRIRQAAIDECAGNSSACSLLDCSKRSRRRRRCAHAPVLIAKHLLNAQFCLQPPGDTATRRSTFDGLLSGCIPVFFTNDSAYNQYTWHLIPPHRPSSYSVLVPPPPPGTDIDGQYVRTIPLLSSFSAQRIARMRSVIVDHLIPRLIYNSPHLATSHPTLRDAFQITVDGMLRRAHD